MHSPLSSASGSTSSQCQRCQRNVPLLNISKPTPARATNAKQVAKTSRLWDIIFKPGRRRTRTMIGTLRIQLRPKMASAARNRFRERCRLLQNARGATNRSEEHTSELQSRFDLVCRLLLEKKKKKKKKKT